MNDSGARDHLGDANKSRLCTFKDKVGRPAGADTSDDGLRERDG